MSPAEAEARRSICPPSCPLRCGQSVHKQLRSPVGVIAIIHLLGPRQRLQAEIADRRHYRRRSKPQDGGQQRPPGGAEQDEDHRPGPTSRVGTPIPDGTGHPLGAGCRAGFMDVLKRMCAHFTYPSTLERDFRAFQQCGIDDHRQRAECHSRRGYDGIEEAEGSDGDADAVVDEGPRRGSA